MRWTSHRQLNRDNKIPNKNRFKPGDRVFCKCPAIRDFWGVIAEAPINSDSAIGERWAIDPDDENERLGGAGRALHDDSVFHEDDPRLITEVCYTIVYEQ